MGITGPECVFIIRGIGNSNGFLALETKGLPFLHTRRRAETSAATTLFSVGLVPVIVSRVTIRGVRVKTAILPCPPRRATSAPPSVGKIVASMRIALVEDILMFREAIAKACELEFGHTVVAETDSGAQAIRAVLRLRPEVLILDLSLPDMNGFAVVERLRASGCPTRVLVLSAYSDDYTIYRVERANVHGFVDKRGDVIAVLGEALRALADGMSYFSPAFEKARRALHANPHSFDKVLSESEQRILCLIGEGLADEEIGGILRISPRTVQTHRHNILRKLRIAGTPKLIAFAMRHGFTTGLRP